MQLGFDVAAFPFPSNQSNIDLMAYDKKQHFILEKELAPGAISTSVARVWGRQKCCVDTKVVHFVH